MWKSYFFQIKKNNKKTEKLQSLYILHDLNQNLNMPFSVFVLMWYDLPLNRLKLMRKYGRKDSDDKKFILNISVLGSKSTKYSYNWAEFYIYCGTSRWISNLLTMMHGSCCALRFIMLTLFCHQFGKSYNLYQNG